MHFLRYFITFVTISYANVIFSAHLPDDIEAGDGVNEIQLPLTKESAAELIRIESNGKILSVDKQSINNKNLFKVKVLHSNGKVKIYRIDPLTGHAPQ